MILEENPQEVTLEHLSNTLPHTNNDFKLEMNTVPCSKEVLHTPDIDKTLEILDLDSKGIFRDVNNSHLLGRKPKHI